MMENQKARTDAASSGRAQNFESDADEALHLDYTTTALPVASRLQIGRENALGKEYLCALLGYKDARTLRKEIEAERCSGAVICFDGDEGGYFVPATVGELRRFVNAMQMRTRTTQESIRAAEALLREVLS